MKKNAVLYARYSDAEQSGGYSLQAQTKACHKYAGDNDLQIVREYIDEAKSAAKNQDKRDNFLEMMLDVTKRDRGFDYIIVHKFDRFSRDAYHSITSKALLTKHRVKLISVLEPSIGSDEPEDKLMELLTIGMAEYYSHNLGREALKGMRERIQEGYLTFSPPYGYKRKVLKDKTQNQ